MIVAAVNLLAYLLLPGRFTAAAEALCLSEPRWAAPRLWRSELRNMFATSMRAGQLALPDALALFVRAEELIGENEYEVDAGSVLQLSQASGCSAYDCEYAALAQHLGVPLVTADARLARAFAPAARLFKA